MPLSVVQLSYQYPLCPSTIYSTMFILLIQEEQEREQKRLEEIMEENNRKILEAQQKLVGTTTNTTNMLKTLSRLSQWPQTKGIILVLCYLFKWYESQF